MLECLLLLVLDSLPVYQSEYNPNSNTNSSITFVVLIQNIDSIRLKAGNC